MYIQGSLIVAMAIMFGSLIEKKNQFPIILGDISPERLQQENQDKDLLILFLLIALLLTAFLKFSKFKT